jgi:predicted esterase
MREELTVGELHRRQRASHGTSTGIVRAGFLVIFLLAAPGPGNVVAQACTPFGDPPATLVGQQTVPLCTGGHLLGPWNDSDGTPRYACLYESSNASTLNPLPLIVFLHPSLASADALRLTNILDSINTADVSDDPSRLGFIVIAPEGRNITHFYPAPNDQGLGWDVWYRQVDPSGDLVRAGVPYKENVDATTIDHFIAQEVATGKVDRRRIYLTGWSNGAAMAYLYGTSRLNIAAISPYSAPNPWQAFNDPCPQAPVSSDAQDPDELQIFNLLVPTMHVHNACDIAGICPNGELMDQQLQPTGVSVQDTILDWSGTPFPGQAPGPVVTNACDPLCGTNPLGEDDLSFSTEGTQNHIRWPFDQTAAMVDFFRRHPALCTAPAVSCRTAAKSVFTMKHNPSKGAKDSLIWRWLKGAATTPTDLGLPTGTTNYALCVYAGTAVATVALPAGAKWRAAGTKGFKFTDPTGTPDGAQKALLKSGAAGKAKALVAAKGANLPDGLVPALPLPVTVQLMSTTSTCFETVYGTAIKNDAKEFKAKTP